MAKSSKQATVPMPPDGGYGWVVLASCFFISFIVDGCMYSIGLVLGGIKTHYNATQEIANLLPSLNSGFLFCSGPIVSGLSNQFGIRKVVMGGAVITALVYVLSAFSPSIYLIMGSFGVVGGITTGCTYIASLIIVAQYFDKLKGMATGICMAGSGVGAFSFAYLTNFTMGRYGWEITMIMLGAILLQCAILGALLKPVPTVPVAKETSQAADALNNVQTFSGSVVSIAKTDADDEDISCCKNCLNISANILREMTDFRLLKDNIAFLFIALSNFFIFFGYFIPFILIPVRAAELGITNAATLLSTIGIINIPGRLFFGFIADRKLLSATNLNTLSGIIATLALISYPFLTTFYTQICFSVVFAVGISGLNCLTTPYLTEIVGMERFSNAMGLINLFRGLGCFFGPFVGGYISDKTKMVTAAFMFSGGTFVIGLIFALLVSLGSMCKLFKSNQKYTPPTNA